jgi:NAD(P)H dehydrogenase (quinone)
VTAKIAVIYYSSTGNTHRLADAVAEGARRSGADVRFRTVAELAPPEAVASNAAWQAHREETSEVERATLDDLEWADGIAFGTPTRYGLVTAQLKQFIDSTGPLWGQGKLVDKAITVFTGAQTEHGGHETTIAALFNVFVHWGAIIVPLGYTSDEVFQTGTPYGATWVSGKGTPPDDVTVEVARQQGARLAAVAGRLATAASSPA